jgi:hypothetical protein
MARRLVLRNISVAAPEGHQQEFRYGELLLVILRHAPPNRGLTLDDVLQAVDAQTPIEHAVKAGAEDVTLTETQYQILLGKLSTFPFGIADRTIAEFGLMVRNAPELGTEEVAAAA